jgi:hypothetical protein
MAEFTSVRSGSLTHPQMLKPMDPLGRAALIESMESLGKILAGAFLSLYAPLQSRQKSLNLSALSSV